MRTTLLIPLIAALVLAMCPSPVRAQRLRWEQLNAPAQGPIYSVMRLRDGRMLAGSAYHIFTSNDNGATWTRSSSLLTGYQVYSLAADSAGGLYASTGSGPSAGGGVFRSTDGGSTWLPARTGIPFSASVYNIGLDRDGMLYAATDGFGLFRSSDHGTSWQKAEVRDEFDSVVKNFYGVRFAGSPGGPLYITGTNGIYRTVGNGLLWRICGTTYSNVTAPLVMVDPTGLVYRSNGTGVDQSDDSGATWTTFTTGGSRTSAVAMSSIGTLIGIRNDSLFRSPDLATTWKAIHLADYTFSVEDVQAGEGWMLIATNQGVYRSLDEGVTWKALNIGISTSDIIGLAADSSGAIVAAVVQQGVYRSSDGGASWTNTGPPGNGRFPGYYYATSVSCDAQGHIYLFSLDSLHVSTDAGATWRVPPYTDAPMGLTEIHTRPGGLALAAFADGSFGSVRIARSTDYGRSWGTYSIYPTDKNYRFQMLPNGHLFAGTNRQIMYSLDTGRTWKQRSNGVPDNRPTSELLATQSGKLIAATSVGLYRTANEGVTWDSLGKPFRTDSVQRMIQLRSGRILALVRPRLFSSDDEGTTWDTAYAGEHYLVQIVESSDGDLFAGTYDGGLLRIRHTVDVPKKEEAADALAMRSIIATPDGATVRIEYAAAAGTPVRITLSDMLGVAVYSSTATSAGSGNHAAAFDVSSLPSGHYVCRLECGGVSVARVVDVGR